MQIKILSILKVVSFESLAGDYFSERGAQAEAHWERNLNRQLWSIIIDEKHRIAVQGIFVGIIIKAGDASVKVTDLMFAVAFCKKQLKPGKLVSSLVWLFAVCCLLISIDKFSEPSF